jgi:hypothetical protein
MAELKTKKNNASVVGFLGTIKDERKQKDAYALLELFEEVTGEQAKMWGSSIIGFGEQPYSRADGSEHMWMKTGFSPRKQNLTLYIMTGFDEYAEASGYDPKPLLSKLGPHTHGKSCLYIKHLADVDKHILRQLIKQSIQQQGKAQ